MSLLREVEGQGWKITVSELNGVVFLISRNRGKSIITDKKQNADTVS
jgi:hypothetical protein